MSSLSNIKLENGGGGEEIDLYGDTDDHVTEQDVLGEADDDEHDEIVDEDAILQADDEPTAAPGEEQRAADSDLLDAVLTEPAAGSTTGANISAGADHSANAGGLNSSNTSLVTGLGGGTTGGKKYCVYVGNMTWWTTDADLQDLVTTSVGIQDIVDIKFYDNRSNGQSKGFALLVMHSEQSQRVALEKIPEHQLHGQQLVALAYTKTNLATLESATRRPEDDRRMKKEQQQNSTQPQPQQNVYNAPSLQKNENFLGTVRIASGPSVNPPVMPQMSLPQMTIGAPMMRTVISAAAPGMPPRVNLVGQPVVIQHPQQLQPTRITAMPPRPMVSGPPPVSVGVPPPGMSARPPPGYVFPSQQPPQPQQQPQIVRVGAPPPATHQPPPGFPPPGSYVNPSVYPNVSGSHPSQHQQQHVTGHSTNRPPSDSQQPLSEAEFEEIMNRNRTVSSSAISRAVSDAAAGDYASAIETLVTAISLIRQSRVAQDDRCKVLISSLQDTLHGIEAKSYQRGRGSKDRSRDRSRSPDRHKRRRRSSRSRSRSRDRGYSERDYSPRHHSSSSTAGGATASASGGRRY